MQYTTAIATLLSMVAAASAVAVPAQPNGGDLAGAIVQLVESSTNVDGSAQSIESVVQNALNVAKQAGAPVKRGSLSKRQNFQDALDQFLKSANNGNDVQGIVDDALKFAGQAANSPTGTGTSSVSCVNGVCVTVVCDANGNCKKSRSALRKRQAGGDPCDVFGDFNPIACGSGGAAGNGNPNCDVFGDSFDAINCSGVNLPQAPEGGSASTSCSNGNCVTTICDANGQCKTTRGNL